MMTFDEFKAEIIDRQKRLEINQFLHLYIKAVDFADALDIVKRIADMAWSIDNGIIDTDLISQVPTADLEAAGIYTGSVILSDITGPVYIYNGALTLSQSGMNRGKVILINSTMTATATDQSMIELETYLNSEATLTANGYAYLHITNRGQSTCLVTCSADSIVKLNAFNNSNTTIDESGKSFVNMIAADNATVQVNNRANCKIVSINNSLVTSDI